MAKSITKFKDLKLREDLHKKLLKYCSEKQVVTGERFTLNKAVEQFLKEGTINLNIPPELAERLRKQCQKIYGTETLNEGISKILEDWVKERKKK